MTETSAPAAIAIAAPAPRTGLKDWIAIISMVLAIGAVMLTTGKLLGQVSDNTRRIETLEVRADRRDDELRELGAKIAGIDAKLDLLIRRLPSER